MIGSNEGELRDKLNKNTNIQTKNKKRDREIKSWETFWDDMIFLDKLAMIGCYESKNDKFKSLIPRIYNKKVISQHDQLYYVGFPQEANKDATGTGKSSSYIRIVEYEWINIYCNPGFVMRLKKEKNRALILPNPTKKRIKEEMRSLAAKNVTHIHKYKCPTTLTTKYCNAIFNKRGKRNSGPSITIMKGDEISLKWLYNTAVGLNNCQQWYDHVTDPSVNNKTFEVPIAGVNQNRVKPKRDLNCPTVIYTQNKQGICGISAFSSAFAYIYDKELALHIYKQRENYLASLSSSIMKMSKRSAAMKYLMEILFTKKFRKYGVRRIKQMIDWKHFINDTGYFDSIMICILKAADMSRDHIVAITKGWIFDGNLNYALKLDEDSLTWCCSQGDSDCIFVGFYEQVQIYKKT